MTTTKQLEANKRNAQRSTGPRTEVGKARSRLNSRKHGLTAKMLIIVGEHADDFDELRAELLEQYDPQSAFECELVERVAGILWRLRRVPFFEAAILDARQARLDEDTTEQRRQLLCLPYGRLRERTEEEIEEEEEDAREEGDEADEDDADEGADLRHSIYVGSSLIEDGIVGDVLGKLLRYETTLMNNLKKTLEMLHENRGGMGDNGVVIEAVALPVEDGNGSIAA